MTTAIPDLDTGDIRTADRARRLAAQTEFAPDAERWYRRNRYHNVERARLYGLHVPPGSSVLHIGCGLGHTLAELKPGRGVGIELAPAMIDQAREMHADLDLRVADPQDFDLGGETFDFIIVDEALADMGDIHACLTCARSGCRADTRLILGAYSALWGPILPAGSAVGLRQRTREQNWLGPEDLENFVRLAGFDMIRRAQETLLPVRVPGLNWLCNRLLARFWPIRHLDLMQIAIARPLVTPDGAEDMTCTVLIPTHNERGNIEAAIQRLPKIGAHTEVIFVDGSSTDGTPEEIERVQRAYPDVDIRFIPQGAGIGKGDAVRKGFAAASCDVLMILDADLTVPPEDLPRFFDALVSGQGEFINGTRLVYPMEDEAMRFLNKCGNRFFSLLFTWLLDQRFRDTLCGTKVLTKKNYDRLAANRSYFGDFDPFGDFDLIFGASRMNLKIVETPVRYRARTYGETSISRFSHGWLLLKMSWVAFKRIKLR